MIICLVGKCATANAQCKIIKLEKGGIAICDSYIAVNTKKEHHYFTITRIDTVRGQIYYRLKGHNYQGFIIDSNGCYKLEVRYKYRPIMIRTYWPRKEIE
jgi:hypothetical protein